MSMYAEVEYEETMGKYGGMSGKNHGYGRNMAYAGTQVLQARFGGGHFSSVASHGDRWNSFSTWAKQSAGVKDMRDINKETVVQYGAYLREQGLAAATIQNRISTINVVMSHAREGQWEKLSPRELAGRSRSTVRTEAPKSYTAERYTAAHSAMTSAGLARAAAVFGLAREFGMRSEEASKANLDRLDKEMRQRGEINIVDGTKGGRTAPRWVAVTPAGREALAAAIAARPEGSSNMLRPNETYKNWRAGELRAGREILHEHGIRGYHDARAAYACARYTELTGHAAPAVSGGRRTVDRATDQAARRTISTELGHGRTDVAAAYVGSAR